MNNLTPMQWLFILAPSAVVAGVLFILFYESSDMERRVLIQDQEVRQMEFDRDFANAWNGSAIEAPANDIDAAKQRLAALKDEQDAKRQARDEKLMQLREKMEKEINREYMEIPPELLEAVSINNAERLSDEEIESLTFLSQSEIAQLKEVKAEQDKLAIPAELLDADNTKGDSNETN